MDVSDTVLAENTRHKGNVEWRGTALFDACTSGPLSTDTALFSLFSPAHLRMAFVLSPKASFKAKASSFPR
jgi:hypothetical protein